MGGLGGAAGDRYGPPETAGWLARQSNEPSNIRPSVRRTARRVARPVTSRGAREGEGRSASAIASPTERGSSTADTAHGADATPFDQRPVVPPVQRGRRDVGRRARFRITRIQQFAPALPVAVLSSLIAVREKHCCFPSGVYHYRAPEGTRE